MPRKSWWARLPFGVRMAAGTSALLMAIGGGAAGIAALTRDDAKPRIVTAVGDAATPGAVSPEQPPGPQPPSTSVAVPSRTSAEANRSAGRNPAREPGPVGALPKGTAKAQPEPAGPAARASAAAVITTRTDVETREIPYPTRTVSDPGLPSGSQRVQTPGVAGEETLRYLVTLTDGRPTGRRLLDSTVTRQPQPEVVALGAPNAQQPAGHCPLSFCVPLGRDGGCRPHRRDESADVGDAGQVSVAGNDVAVLTGGHGDGFGDEHGGWHRGGRGNCR